MKSFSFQRNQHTSTRRQIPEFLLVFCMASALYLLPNGQTNADPSIKTGGVHGQVTVTRKLTSQRMRFRLYPGFKPLPPPTAEEISNDERRNVVIYLEDTPPLAEESLAASPPQIVQQGETFIPHVLPIVKGTTVDFPNSDPIFHNVFSLSGTRTFDLGRYPQGDSRAVTFEQPGIVPVFCHLHSNMSAVVLVLDNPYFAVPNAEGRYSIDGIPEGTYPLIGWHERSERVEQEVTIIAGKSVELDIVIPIEDEEP